MKILIILLALFLVETFSFSAKNELHEKWTQFKINYKKSYHPSEENKRLTIFKKNLLKIEEHNKLFEKKQVSFKMALNQFADLDTGEFTEFFTKSKIDYKHSSNNYKLVSSGRELPDEIDWREKGAVTDVENQGQCGSSWIYSLTGVFEGQNFIQNGKLIPLSNQELADCASDAGCSGGTIESGYEYIKQNGLSAAADYPINDDGQCHRDSIPAAVNETDYLITKGDENTLKAAVATIGPIAAEVDASNWQFYAGGILSCQTAANLNHGVLVVGYGHDTESPADFWIIKNSWGSAWGENGYVRLARTGTGNCGVTSRISYPML